MQLTPEQAKIAKNYRFVSECKGVLFHIFKTKDGKADLENDLIKYAIEKQKEIEKVLGIELDKVKEKKDVPDTVKQDSESKVGETQGQKVYSGKRHYKYARQWRPV